MPPFTVVAPYRRGPFFDQTMRLLLDAPAVADVVIVCPDRDAVDPSPWGRSLTGSLLSGETLMRIIEDVRSEYLVMLPGAGRISIEPAALERMREGAGSTWAGIVYCDFYEEQGGAKTLHPLNDYQPGSVRDDFDFGAILLFSVPAVREAIERHGPIPKVDFAGLYDLRLKVSIDRPVHHLKEALYSVTGADDAVEGEALFSYVDPRNQVVQREMETVFTDYLKAVGAYVPSRLLRDAPTAQQPFPVEASVIIPVKDRAGTIGEAVKSALSQETPFPFNVIVVDNHSTAGTARILSELSAHYPAVHHVVPSRTDLAIGGCWNEALQSQACGRYAVQLDSDDLYGSRKTLQAIVGALTQGRYAMVIGSYTIVNFDLNEVPPGLIDHREWTNENGHNNALRINGLGAPRAFDTALIREIGFQNVSYGEDYAAALRISREYHIGRIYESLYLCRRWPGNTDAALPIEATNRNNAFKDKVRGDEIAARKALMDAHE